MAVISISIPGARSAAEDLRDLGHHMGQVRADVDQIRGGLTFEISCRERIALSLRAASQQVEQEQTAVINLTQGLDTIVALYVKEESDAKEHLASAAKEMTSSGITYDRADGKDILETSSKDKDQFITQFEQEHPEFVQQLNAFLSSGTDNKLKKDDIRNIKYLVYTANEPFRTIFLQSLGRYWIGDGDMNGGAYYASDDRTVNYTYDTGWDRFLRPFQGWNIKDSFRDDPRGGYTTFFHECGHAIDDTGDLTNAAGFDTETFSVYNEAMGREVTLRDAIEYDVFYNRDNPHSMTSIAEDMVSTGIPELGSKGNIDNVIQAFQTGSSDGLSNDDKMLYQAVLNQHRRNVQGGAKVESVTDVYGGMSKNVLNEDGWYHHDTEYWLDENSNVSSAVSLELWAEYYSYNMSGSSKNLENLLEYFPEASKVMEQYAISLSSSM